MVSADSVTSPPTANKEEKDNKMAYDDILLHLGEFGPYQRRIYLLLCLPQIVVALHKLAGVFLQAKAEHRCLLPYELSNTTYYGLTEQQTRLSYPWDTLAKGFSACKMYNTNYTDEYFLNNVPANQTTGCDSYVYNTEKYQSTTVMEWDLVCDSAWLKATSDAIFMIGVLLGSLIFGDLSDRYGRRPIFFFSLVIQCIAGVLAGFAPDYYSFTFFRMIVGASTSGVFLVAYVIGMEMVGPKKRTFAGVAIQYFFTTGFLLTAGFAYYIKNWRHLQIALTVSGVIFFSYYWFIPESARWLLTKGRQEEAKVIVKAAAKENKVDLPEDLLDNLLAPTNVEKKMEEAGEKPSILDLFRYSNLRKKSVIIFFLWFVNSMTYYGLSWNTSNLGGGNDYVNFLICGLVEVPAYTFLLLTLDLWGRKVILCGCMLVSGTALLLTMFVPNDMVWLTITLAMLGKLAITASYGTIYLFSAEQFPTVIRNVGVGASSMFARFGGILAPYINIMAEIWQPTPLLIFGVCALVSGILSLLLPETLNRKLPESIEEGEKFGKKSKVKKTKNGELDPVC